VVVVTAAALVVDGTVEVAAAVEDGTDSTPGFTQ